MDRTPVIVASAAIVMAAVASPPANADQYDFISALDNNGVFYKNISDMITIGKAVCSSVRSQGPDGVQTAINGLAHSGFSGPERGIIVVAAADNMCPDIRPAVHAFANRQAPSPQTPPAESVSHPA